MPQDDEPEAPSSDDFDNYKMKSPATKKKRPSSHYHGTGSPINILFNHYDENAANYEARFLSKSRSKHKNFKMTSDKLSTEKGKQRRLSVRDTNVNSQAGRFGKRKGSRSNSRAAAAVKRMKKGINVRSDNGKLKKMKSEALIATHFGSSKNLGRLKTNRNRKENMTVKSHTEQLQEDTSKKGGKKNNKQRSSSKSKQKKKKVDVLTIAAVGSTSRKNGLETPARLKSGRANADDLMSTFNVKNIE